MTHGAADRSLRADHAAGRAAQRRRATALRVRGLRPPAARRAAATGWSPAPAACSRRWRRFRFDDDELAVPRGQPRWSTHPPWTGSPTTGSPATSDGYAEGECYFPGSPLLTVEGTFAEAVLLETLVLSVLNHDCAIASAASRMVNAAGEPAAHRDGLAAHPRDGGRRRRPGRLPGRVRHHLQPRGRPARTACRPPAPRRTPSPCCTTPRSRRSRPRSTRSAPAPRCWWTPTTWRRPCATAVEVAGPGAGRRPPRLRRPGPGRPRGPRAARRARRHKTRIVVTGDLDEYAIAALAAAPVDAYGVGTSLVTGSGAPDGRRWSTSWWPARTPTGAHAAGGQEAVGKPSGGGRKERLPPARRRRARRSPRWSAVAARPAADGDRAPGPAGQGR